MQPYNGADSVPLDGPVVVRFNMPMQHSSQSAFTLRGQSSVQGVYEWSPDSTVMTFTAASLLSFDTSYRAGFSGQVQAAEGAATTLAGDASTNSWSFNATTTTHVDGHAPDSTGGPAQPSTSFGFYFNNPLAPNQAVEQYLTISPQPEGYNGPTDLSRRLPARACLHRPGVKLLPNTTYKFTLSAGLKDKWGFPVAASSWEVKIGPLPPSLTIQGGSFQPIYVDGPTRVRVETANLDTFTFHLRQLKRDDLYGLLTNPPFYQQNATYPGQLKREWQVQVPGGKTPDKTTTLYPSIGLDASGDRLPAGYYLLYADAPNPYNTDFPLYGATVLIVGRTGVVTKSEGQNLLVWVADLGSGKPVPGYTLRIEQVKNDNSSPVVQKATTGPDGVARLILDKADNISMVAIWADSGDALFSTTGWSRNLGLYDFGGVSASYNTPPYRGEIYVDRPIYRPAQTVYFRGVFRQDDDVVYTLPKAGGTVEVRAFTFGSSSNGPTAVYTGTAVVSASGSVNGQFLIPANAPTGSYTLAFSQPGDTLAPYDYGVASTSFDVQEYRKPDFQVNVTASPPGVHGDPVTAAINTSYYFGGPLRTSPRRSISRPAHTTSRWSDPDTGETYQFGVNNFPPYLFDYYRPGPFATPEPVHSFQARTDANGVLNADVTRYITTTEGSKIGADRGPGAGPEQPDGGRQHEHCRPPGPILCRPADGRLHRHCQAADHHNRAHRRVDAPTRLTPARRWRSPSCGASGRLPATPRPVEAGRGAGRAG